jgi:predicted DNA-binding transcriptional regulator AlpA
LEEAIKLREWFTLEGMSKYVIWFMTKDEQTLENMPKHLK